MFNVCREKKRNSLGSIYLTNRKVRRVYRLVCIITPHPLLIPPQHTFSSFDLCIMGAIFGPDFHYEFFCVLNCADVCFTPVSLPCTNTFHLLLGSCQDTCTNGILIVTKLCFIVMLIYSLLSPEKESSLLVSVEFGWERIE